MPLPFLYSAHCAAGPVAPGYTRCFIFVSFLVVIVVVVVAPVAVVDGDGIADWCSWSGLLVS